MAKQNKTVETGLEGFDDLSKADFIESVTEDTGRAMSNNTGGEETSNDGAGDSEADKILNTFKSREKKAQVASKKEKAAKKEEQQEEEEEIVEEEKVDDKDEETSDEETDEEEEKVEEEEKKDDKKEDKKKSVDKFKKTGKEDKSETDEEDDGKELSFDNIDDKAAPSAEESGGWKEVAKELFGEDDLEEDTFEAFTEKVKKKAEYNIAQFKPETQRLIKATEAGLTIEDFLEPLSKIDAALSLSDADLVDRHLKSTGWSDDAKRQKKIEQMAETGDLEVIAGQARTELKEYRSERKQEIIDARLKAAEKHEQRMKDAYKNEAKEISKVLTAKKEFMATPISEANRERIVKKYEAGDYEKDFKDPQTIADFLLWKEFGKRGESNIRIAAERKFKEKHKEKFHNLPPKGKQAGGAKSTPSGQDPEGNWDNLEKEKISTTEE